MKKFTWAKQLWRYEHLAVVLWLVSDALWMMNNHIAAMITAAPMLAVAIDAALKSLKNNVRLSYTITLCYWFAANATWMAGEFFKADLLALYASVFYVAGLATAVTTVYLLEYKRKKKHVAATQTIYRGLNTAMKKAA